MLQAVSIDAHTLIVRAEKAKDLYKLVEYISKQDNQKKKEVDIFLDFASANRHIDKSYKFVREDCYGEAVC
jgi:hypothetical protein